MLIWREREKVTKKHGIYAHWPDITRSSRTHGNQRTHTNTKKIGGAHSDEMRSKRFLLLFSYPSSIRAVDHASNIFCCCSCCCCCWICCHPSSYCHNDRKQVPFDDKRVLSEVSALHFQSHANAGLKKSFVSMLRK